MNLAMRIDFSAATLSLFSAGCGVHNVVRSQFLAEQLWFPSSLPLQAQMAFARNTCDSRSGDPNDRFESMALELKSDNFEQWDFEKCSDVDCRCKTEDANAEADNDNRMTTKEGARELSAANAAYKVQRRTHFGGTNGWLLQRRSIFGLQRRQPTVRPRISEPTFAHSSKHSKTLLVISQ
jgi:hypothetical protein